MSTPPNTLQASPKTLVDLMNEGILHYKAMRYQEALIVYEQAIAIDV
jgi:tetratricopeptide (TPR) repeat protein